MNKQSIATFKAPRSRTNTRLAAVQALYQIIQTGEMADKVIDQFIQNRIVREGNSSFYNDGLVPGADPLFFHKIIDYAAGNREKLTDDIAALLPVEWPLNRLDPVMLSLIWAAGAEFIMEDGAPMRVIINEYMDVAHGFFSGDEPRMVNGLLDALGRKLKRE